MLDLDGDGAVSRCEVGVLYRPLARLMTVDRGDANTLHPHCAALYRCLETPDDSLPAADVASATDPSSDATSREQRPDVTEAGRKLQQLVASTSKPSPPTLTGHCVHSPRQLLRAQLWRAPDPGQQQIQPPPLLHEQKEEEEEQRQQQLRQRQQQPHANEAEEMVRAAVEAGGGQSALEAINPVHEQPLPENPVPAMPAGGLGEIAPVQYAKDEAAAEEVDEEEVDEEEVDAALCRRGDLGPFPCLEDGCEKHTVAIGCRELAAVRGLSGFLLPTSYFLCPTSYPTEGARFCERRTLLSNRLPSSLRTCCMQCRIAPQCIFMLDWPYGILPTTRPLIFSSCDAGSCDACCAQSSCNMQLGEIWRAPQRWAARMRVWEACPQACRLCGEPERAQGPNEDAGSCDA